MSGSCLTEDGEIAAGKRLGLNELARMARRMNDDGCTR